MADRVSISITIGGQVSLDGFAELAGIIADEGLSTEWDGPEFEPCHRKVGEALCLFAHEVAWGRVDSLETWCAEHSLPFVRWSGGYPSQWGPERIVFRGEGAVHSYMVDENDQVVIDRHIVTQRGSIEAILAYFDEADFTVPALVVKGDPEPQLNASQARSKGYG